MPATTPSNNSLLKQNSTSMKGTIIRTYTFIGPSGTVICNENNVTRMSRKKLLGQVPWPFAIDTSSFGWGTRLTPDNALAQVVLIRVEETKGTKGNHWLSSALETSNSLAQLAMNCSTQFKMICGLTLFSLAQDSSSKSVRRLPPLQDGELSWRVPLCALSLINH